MISIVSAIWQRPELTEIFLDSLVRYRKDYGITAVVAGSEGESTRQACVSRGIGYVETLNQPLSAKFNKASMEAWTKYKPDGLMIMGSDDFVNERLIQHYLLNLKQGVDVLGFRDCYFYNAKTKEAVYWPGYTVPHRRGESIGMARLLSAKVFRRLRLRLWSESTAGLDYLMTQRLKKYPKFKRKTLSVKDDNYILVDIKGFGNFCEIAQYETEPINAEVFDTIPEFKQIKEL